MKLRRWSDGEWEVWQLRLSRLPLLERESEMGELDLRLRKLTDAWDGYMRCMDWRDLTDSFIDLLRLFPV